VLSDTLHWKEFSIRKSPALLWPVAWMERFDPAVAGPSVMVASLLALVLCGLAPQLRWTRVLGACALTEYLALRFSLGKIHHSMHGWLLCLLVLCWLPGNWATPWVLQSRGRHRLLCCFHTCQVLLATTYTLSGLGKLLGAGYQWWHGEATFFGLDSVAQHTAARLLETPEHSLLGDWVVRHGPWFWPGAMAVLLLQLCAVWLSLRPGLHVALGAGLITFHVLTTLTMGIDFTPAVMLCGILYLASPFTVTLPARR
jgi:hypothetical protein